MDAEAAAEDMRKKIKVPIALFSLGDAIACIGAVLIAIFAEPFATGSVIVVAVASVVAFCFQIAAYAQASKELQVYWSAAISTSFAACVTSLAGSSLLHALLLPYDDDLLKQAKQVFTDISRRGIWQIEAGMVAVYLALACFFYGQLWFSLFVRSQIQELQRSATDNIATYSSKVSGLTYACFGFLNAAKCFVMLVLSVVGVALSASCSKIPVPLLVMTATSLVFEFLQLLLCFIDCCTNKRWLYVLQAGLSFSAAVFYGVCGGAFLTAVSLQHRPENVTSTFLNDILESGYKDVRVIIYACAFLFGLNSALTMFASTYAVLKYINEGLRPLNDGTTPTAEDVEEGDVNEAGRSGGGNDEEEEDDDDEAHHNYAVLDSSCSNFKKLAQRTGATAYFLGAAVAVQSTLGRARLDKEMRRAGIRAEHLETVLASPRDHCVHMIGAEPADGDAGNSA